MEGSGEVSGRAREAKTRIPERKNPVSSVVGFARKRVPRIAVRQRTDDDRTRREPAQRGRRDVPGDLSTAETRARDASEARQTAGHARNELGTYLALSPSRSSTASWMPVEAPEGVIARNMPLCV